MKHGPKGQAVPAIGGAPPLASPLVEKEVFGQESRLFAKNPLLDFPEKMCCPERLGNCFCGGVHGEAAPRGGAHEEKPFACCGGHLGIEALRRENEKFLEAEVSKWNALTPHEKPFEWKGKSAAEILAWRSAKAKRVLVPRENPAPRADGFNSVQAQPARAEPADKRYNTLYEEKFARWKRAILEQKIVDLDDAAFDEKFAEWDAHAQRLEALKQEIAELERKAIELKVTELKEQAARQQAKQSKAAKPTVTKEDE